MIFEPLPWDSNFFKKNIGRIVISPGDSAQELQNVLDAAQFDCCYLFLPHPIPEEVQQLLEKAGARCQDLKTLFVKNRLERHPGPSAKIVPVQEVREDCYRLAIASGWMSRFETDERFRPYRAGLYRLWVDKCLADPHGKVWEVRRQGKLQGMMCASCSERTGHLGLIAVAPESRGSGIGSALMYALENYYLDMSAVRAEVITQYHNTGARRLYEKSGYQQISITEIWHLWTQ